MGNVSFSREQNSCHRIAYLAPGGAYLLSVGRALIGEWAFTRDGR